MENHVIVVIVMNELSYYFSQMLKCIQSLYLRRKTVTNLSLIANAAMCKEMEICQCMPKYYRYAGFKSKN